MSENELKKRASTSPRVTGLYLNLFHGRKDQQANLSDWGSQGPFIGPLQYCRITYNSSIALKFKDGYETGPLSSHGDGLCIVSDMILFADVYYGDWTLALVEGDAL